MADTRDQNGATSLFAGGFALILSIVAVITWIEALDFDPCDTFLKYAGTDCLEPGITGFAAGGLAVFVGGSIAWGAYRNGPRVYGRWEEPLLLGWLGLAMAATGAAIAYAQWSLGL